MEICGMCPSYLWGGEIHAVQAFLKILPEATQRGWN
jgi:hypothetical protein